MTAKDLDNLPLSNSEITHYTNLWCRNMGFKSKDLTEHPQIDDVILLVKWTKEFKDCPKFWRANIQRIWSYVYVHKMPMKQNHIKKLGKITEGIITWRKKRDLDKATLKAFYRTRKKTVSPS
jgi:hypothetical protein